MKVSIGVDDSPFSGAAVEYAKQTTWPVGTSILVVSASPPIFMGPGEVVAPGAIAEIIQHQETGAKEVAEKAAATLKDVGLDAKARMVPSDPRDALVDTARDLGADLVVVGSHGRSGLKKLLLGSVATHVVTHAHCNVLVVKRQA
jgi:nucleotide-binding universal stress UspA family protein